MLPEDFGLILENWWKEGSIFTPKMKELFEKGFKHYISDPISETWENIKKKSSEALEQLAEVIRGKLNPIITVINGMLSRLTDGINSMIRALNALSFDVPDWVPGIGGKSFGLNIGEITSPKIPYLATGAVIPPNAPFMAMLGDQKHGTNLEAPEDLIRQIVREEAGGSREMMDLLRRIAESNQVIAEKNLTIGDREIAKANTRGMRSMGYQLLTEE